MSRNIVLIFGMHRSGTSLLARSLEVLGIELGNDLLPPSDRNNEKGFFEDREVVNINDRILNSIGAAWHSLEMLDDDVFESELMQRHLENLLTVVDNKFSSKVTTYAIKDPRLCKTFPLWKRAFAQRDINVSVLLAYRNPSSVLSSLKKRDSFSPLKSLFLWHIHVFNALSYSRSFDSLVVSYENMLRDSEGELFRIASFLGIDNFDPKKVKHFASEFVDKSLNHNAISFSMNSLYEYVGNDSVPETIPTLAQLLESLASDKMELVSRETNDIFGGLQKSIEDQKPLYSALARFDKEVEINNLGKEVSSYKNQLIEKQVESQVLKEQVMDLEKSLQGVLCSRSWKVTAPLRNASDRVKQLTSSVESFRYLIRKHGGLRKCTIKSLRILRGEGISSFKRKLDTQIALSQTPRKGLESALCNTFARKPHVRPVYVDDSKGQTLAEQIGTVGIHIHLFYDDMIDEFLTRLELIPTPFDIFVSVPKGTDTDKVASTFKSRLSRVADVFVEEVPNRGRDIAPMIVQFGPRLSKYDVIAHFHSKKSLHRNCLSGWCERILDSLLGKADVKDLRVCEILRMLSENALIIYPEGEAKIIQSRTNWGANYQIAKELLAKYTSIEIEKYSKINFVEGSMFWAKSAAVGELLNLPISWNDFPKEPIPADGTLPHAIERTILVFADHWKNVEQRGGDFVCLCDSDSIKDYSTYEYQKDYRVNSSNSPVRVLSYYLPQFHPIPENDEWHGKGFTEWTKVKSANPLFEGHYQQHIPHSDLGYYLLDSPDTLRFQAEMMKRAGVEGQIFYHYWFSGKMILEKPAQMVLENPDIDMPFCFCWANENWTRKWDGNEDDVLLSQNYSDQDALDFITYIFPFFRDKRYLRVNGRPLLFVYRPDSIPDPSRYIEIWRDACISHDLPAPYVVGVMTRGASSPEPYDMDAGVERPLHDWTNGNVLEIKNTLSQYEHLSGSVLDYAQVADYYIESLDSANPNIFRSVIPMWDNTPRYGSSAYIVHESTPKKFQQWLEAAIDWTVSNFPRTQERLVVINAWNEWAESAHLEPDSRHGWAYLNSIGRALSGLTYGHDINNDDNSGDQYSVRILFDRKLVDDLDVALKSDKPCYEKFMNSLASQSLFAKHEVHLDCLNYSNELLKRCASEQVKVDSNVTTDFTVVIRTMGLMEEGALESLIGSSAQEGCVIFPNYYDRGTDLPLANEIGAVDASLAYEAPLLVLPREDSYEVLRAKVRTNIYYFGFYPSVHGMRTDRKVTTIIRLHESASLESLKRAIFTLCAQEGCVVSPLVACQSFDEGKLQEVKQMIISIFAHLGSYSNDSKCLVVNYDTNFEGEDIRSLMLNEAAKLVETDYFGFLDYDDMLLSHAYSYLLDRLEQTGKAISFGRVYSTRWQSSSKRFIERRLKFDKGDSYRDFFEYNLFPLHSFLIDARKIDVTKFKYHRNQKYLEDYFFSLQAITESNADWESLVNFEIVGDYMHDEDSEQTLAFNSEEDRDCMLNSFEYSECEKIIYELKMEIKKRMQD